MKKKWEKKKKNKQNKKQAVDKIETNVYLLIFFFSSNCSTPKFGWNLQNSLAKRFLSADVTCVILYFLTGNVTLNPKKHKSLRMLPVLRLIDK